jgi:hypothetical protein
MVKGLSKGDGFPDSDAPTLWLAVQVPDGVAVFVAVSDAPTL